MADMSLRGFVYRNGGFYMSENILRIQNVEKYYGSRNNLTKAIDDISFDVNKGEFVAIMGASGSAVRQHFLTAYLQLIRLQVAIYM